MHNCLHTHETVADRQARERAAAGKQDPTRTALVRKRFEQALSRRFSTLSRAITQVIVDDDGLGLINGLGVVQANKQQFDFPRSSDKVRAFMQWLRRMERQNVLELREGETIESAAQSAWTNVYIDTAYQRGIRNAVGHMKRAGATVQDRWIDTAFLRPVHADRVGLIYTRTYSELAGITQTMDSRISRVLSLGLAEGRSPRDIARDLNREVGISRNRSRMIARTEVVAAHAEASLNAYQEAGIIGVGVEAEWLTTGDSLVCELCADLEGREFTIDEARNMLPRHPNCRCTWVPKIEDARGIELR